MRFHIKNGEEYKAKRSVPEAKKIDKIILKSFCVNVQTKDITTFEEASNIAYYL